MKSLFIFIELASSFLLFVRFASDLRTNRLINERKLFFMVCGYLLFIFLSAIFSVSSLVLLTILLFLPILFIFLLAKWFSSNHKLQFKNNILPLLDQVILFMNGGLAFRSAFDLAIQKRSDFSRIKLEQIRDQLNLSSSFKPSDQHEPLVIELINEFRKVENETHLSSLRLLQLRNKFKKEKYFTAKRNRALSPVRAQVTVLSILYLLALIYACLRPGAADSVTLIVLSILLFIGGATISLYFARSFKWRV